MTDARLEYAKKREDAALIGIRQRLSSAMNKGKTMVPRAQHFA